VALGIRVKRSVGLKAARRDRSRCVPSVLDTRARDYTAAAARTVAGAGDYTAAAVAGTTLAGTTMAAVALAAAAAVVDIVVAA